MEQSGPLQPYWPIMLTSCLCYLPCPTPASLIYWLTVFDTLTTLMFQTAGWAAPDRPNPMQIAI